MGSPMQMMLRTHPFDPKLAFSTLEKGEKNVPHTAVPACTIGFWAFFSFEQDRPLSVWCFALGGQTLVGRLEGLLISQAGPRPCQTFSLLLSIALQHQFISYGP